MIGPHLCKNSWETQIISIHDGVDSRRKDKWLEWTRVTHHTGGKITLRRRFEPRGGWPSYWQEYRRQHPELEQFYRPGLFG